MVQQINTIMLVTKVSRSYSKSINTKNYGIPESWIKIEAVYEATCESGDDPTKVSEMMYNQAKQDVITNTVAVIDQIKASLNPSAPAATVVTPATTTPRQL